jgi:hypothetical protein
LRDVVEVEQHEQPAPWALLVPAPWALQGDDNTRGAWALRSFVACASRVSAAMLKQPGAVSMTRGARFPHAGQSAGSSYSDIGRIVVNGPHPLHIYS